MHKTLKYLPSLIMFAVIAYLSLRTSSDDSMSIFKNIPYWDKIGHFLMYSALGASIYIAPPKKYISFLFAAIYGGVIELLQEYFFPPRTGEWLDWLADILGVTAGMLFFYCLLALRDFRKK